MDLTLDKPGNHLFIRSVSAEGIRILEDIHTGPIVVSANEVMTNWPVVSPGDLNESRLDQILELEPEIVLIGTGSKQVFPPPELMVYLYSRNVGVEIMTTDAACRTFNVLVSEQRKVVAVLMPVS